MCGDIRRPEMQLRRRRAGWQNATCGNSPIDARDAQVRRPQRYDDDMAAPVDGECEGSNEVAIAVLRFRRDSFPSEMITVGGPTVVVIGRDGTAYLTAGGVLIAHYASLGTFFATTGVSVRDFDH